MKHFFLHNHDISPLLVKERIVFLVGQDTLESYFEDMQTLLPQEVFGYDHTSIQSIMDTIAAGYPHQRQKTFNNYL